MGSATLEIKVEDTELQNLANKLNFSLKSLDTKNLMQIIGQEVLATTLLRFHEGKSPDGTKWPITLREKYGSNKPTLHGAGGLLAQSYTAKASSNSVEVGSNKVYAAIHHFGGEIVPKKAKFLYFKINGKSVFAKKVTIPARPALGISDEDEENIIQTTEEWLELKLKAFKG